MKVLAVTEKCVGCGYCETVCPTSAIIAEGTAKLTDPQCLAFTRPVAKSGKPSCLICVSFCPVPGALEVDYGHD